MVRAGPLRGLPNEFGVPDSRRQRLCSGSAGHARPPRHPTNQNTASSPTLPAQLLAFINAYVLTNSANRLAVFASTTTGRWGSTLACWLPLFAALWPGWQKWCLSPAALNPFCSYLLGEYLGRAARQQQQDLVSIERQLLGRLQEVLVLAEAGGLPTGPAPLLVLLAASRAPSTATWVLVELLGAPPYAPWPVQPPRAHASTRSIHAAGAEAPSSHGSGLSSGLSRALCYINRAIKSERAAGGGKARLLCLTAAADDPRHYIAVMNAIFSAQVGAGWGCMRVSFAAGCGARAFECRYML